MSTRQLLLLALAAAPQLAVSALPTVQEKPGPRPLPNHVFQQRDPQSFLIESLVDEPNVSKALFGPHEAPTPQPRPPKTSYQDPLGAGGHRRSWFGPRRERSVDEVTTGYGSQGFDERAPWRKAAHPHSRRSEGHRSERRFPPPSEPEPPVLVRFVEAGTVVRCDPHGRCVAVTTEVLGGAPLGSQHRPHPQAGWAYGPHPQPDGEASPSSSWQRQWQALLDSLALGTNTTPRTGRPDAMAVAKATLASLMLGIGVGLAAWYVQGMLGAREARDLAAAAEEEEEEEDAQEEVLRGRRERALAAGTDSEARKRRDAGEVIRQARELMHLG